MTTIWGKAHKIFLACVSRTVRHRIKICNVTHSMFLSVSSGRGNKHFFLMRKSKFCAISVKSSWHLQRSKSWHFSWLGFPHPPSSYGLFFHFIYPDRQKKILRWGFGIFSNNSSFFSPFFSSYFFFSFIK